MKKLFSTIVRKLNDSKTLIGAGLTSFVVGLILVTQQFASLAVDDMPVLALNSSKQETYPGETTEITAAVQNDTRSDIHGVNIYYQTPPEYPVDYVPGSTKLVRDGESIPIDDNWINTGVNIGNIAVDKEKRLIYEVKIRENAQVGTTVWHQVAFRWAEHEELIGRKTPTNVVPRNENTALKQDFLRVINVTHSTDRDTQVHVNNNEIIEYFVWLENTGTTTAKNVKVFANFNGGPATSLNPSVTLSGDNIDAVTDTVRVFSESPFSLRYFSGHAYIYGNTGVYNCPNGCRTQETFMHNPMILGDIQPGTSAVIQFSFKNGVVGTTPTPTPTVTPTPKPTPSPTPSVTPTPSPRVYSCNSVCVPLSNTGGQDVCSKALGSNYACIKVSSPNDEANPYRCRLKANPSSAQCLAPSPKPSPSPSVTPTPSPSPSPVPGTTGFVISKFEDVDGDGGRDDGEKGLTWEFEWEKNGDGNWRQYVTDANNDGYGETMKGFNDNDTIKIREKGRDSWKATTPTEVSLTLRKDQVMHARFGNQPQKPGIVTTTPNPTQLPATGSQEVGMIVMAIGTFMTGLGLKKKYTN